MKQVFKFLSNHRPQLLVGVAILAIVGVGLWQLSDNQQKTPASSSTQSIAATSKKIDYTPGTAAEQKAADANKDQHVDENTGVNSPSPTKSVTPLISYTSSGPPVQISAYVPGIVENGGTCILHASLGSQTVSPAPTRTAVMNPSDTSCGTFSIARSKFPSSGNWSVTIEYKSSTYSGTSAAQTVTVN